VPHYVPGTPSPKATLALVTRVCDLLKVRVATTKLEVAAHEYEREVNRVVEADEDVARYVRRIERRADETLEQSGALPSGEALAAELERFLREQDGP
jgi:predicted ATP-grasp superfamily ATP-dependent carboligase